MPVTDATGRRVGVRRNGACYVSVFDNRRSNEFTVDYAKAGLLADALENATPCHVSDTHAQVLELKVEPIGMSENGVVPELAGPRLLLGEHRHEPQGKPQQPTGPWELSVQDCVKLASEIRELLPVRAA